MSTPWPALPRYDEWRATCDTLHAHTQLLGKLSVALAPPEPQLQHAALRLTARGWETAPLPAPDGSGVLVVALDLHAHEAVIEHSDGRVSRVPLRPDRPVGAVTQEVIEKIEKAAGPVALNMTPQEVAWSVPLDEDDEHHTYNIEQVATYFSAASRAALVLAAVRAPYRGRSSPVNAWWGTFDLAVSLFSGEASEPPSQDFIMRNAGDAQQAEIGWWPGDSRYAHAAFFAFAAPAPESWSEGTLVPSAARWDTQLGEYVLDWDAVIASPDPFGAGMAFGRSALAHACTVCGWDPQLSASTQGHPPPVH